VRRSVRIVAVGLALISVTIGALTAHWFLWPALDRPGRADAIVVFEARGDPVNTAISLARRGYAPALAISVDAPVPLWCTTLKIPHVSVHCFNPIPKTTQGEARATAALARQYHWSTVDLVAIRPQATRARLRLSRCYGGGIRLISAPIAKRDYPYRVLYEWGAMLKALTLQRGC
jgi:hypothetical protein